MVVTPLARSRDSVLGETVGARKRVVLSANANRRPDSTGLKRLSDVFFFFSVLARTRRRRRRHRRRHGGERPGSFPPFTLDIKRNTFSNQP